MGVSCYYGKVTTGMQPGVAHFATPVQCAGGSNATWHGRRNYGPTRIDWVLFSTIPRMGHHLTALSLDRAEKPGGRQGPVISFLSLR